MSDGLYYDCYRIRSPESFPMEDLGPVHDRKHLSWSKDSPLRYLPTGVKVAMVVRWNESACWKHGHDWRSEGCMLDNGPLFCVNCPARSYGRPGPSGVAVREIGQGQTRAAR